MHARSRNLSLSAAGLLGIAAFGAAVTGCASGDRVSISDSAYQGPEITRSAAAAKHTLILTAPSGGWSFTVDRTERTLDSTRVFATARRPNPAYMQTQALVSHEVTTGVAADRPITVYVRILEHDQGTGAYQPVRPSPDAPPAP